MEKFTDDDSIINFLVSTPGKIKLTQAQEEKLERLEFAWDQKRLHLSKYKVVNAIANKYKRSKRRADDDYNSMMHVYGARVSHNKNAHIAILLERNIRTYKMAEAKQDPTAMARCDATYVTIIEKFMGDKEAIDMSEVNLNTMVFVNDSTVLGIENPLSEQDLQKELMKLGRVDKELRPAKLSITKNTEYAKFTEVDES
jgi:hypothetical protein